MFFPEVTWYTGSKNMVYRKQKYGTPELNYDIPEVTYVLPEVTYGIPEVKYGIPDPEV